MLLSLLFTIVILEATYLLNQIQASVPEWGLFSNVSVSRMKVKVHVHLRGTLAVVGLQRECFSSDASRHTGINSHDNLITILSFRFSLNMTISNESTLHCIAIKSPHSSDLNLSFVDSSLGLSPSQYRPIQSVQQVEHVEFFSQRKFCPLFPFCQRFNIFSTKPKVILAHFTKHGREQGETFKNDKQMRE